MVESEKTVSLSSSLDLDPLLKDLNEKKLSFRRNIVSLAAELKDVRSRLASQEESFIQETQSRHVAEAKARNLEDEIISLQKCLNERDYQLKTSSSASEQYLLPRTSQMQYLMELDDLRSKLFVTHATAEASAASAQSAQSQCLSLLKELDEKNSCIKENETRVNTLGEQLDQLQRNLQERELSQRQLKEHVLKMENEIQCAVAKVGDIRDCELRRILDEISVKNYEKINKLLTAKDDEISRLRDEIRFLSAQCKHKTKELESQLEKHRRADQELKKKVLKLEFCLQETRSQMRKLQRIGKKRDMALRELREQIALKQYKVADSNDKRNFWETPMFKMDVQGNVSNINEEKANMKEYSENELQESRVKQQEKEADMRELKERLMRMEKQLKLEANSFQDRHFLQQNKGKSMEEVDPIEMEEKTKIERPGKQQAKELKQKAIKEKLIRQQLIFDRQQKEIQELKCTLHYTKTSMEYLKKHHSEEFANLGNQLRALASVASGYHKVLEENRKLYNQVQDLKGNIRVYCRVRPFLPGQTSSTSTLGRMDDQTITIFPPSKTGKDARRNFSFNKVFGPSATQEEIFSDTQPLIRSVLDGYNVCIFAYGQTGSGKTHTMSGPKELNEKTFGVNYRALKDLFYLSEQRKDTFTYEISVQMIEIYNEQVRDLLNDGLHKRLEIRNCSNKGLSVPDANLVHVRSTEEVIEIMNLGQKNRAVSSTAMNDHSSRSHSCLTVHVQGKALTSSNTLRGCMHLVDLAGSERVDKSEVRGERLKEAQHINRSLSALGDVIASLAQKNAHVPYRNSKLTQLLQDSLGGQAKTLMFVHISPEVDALGETLSTLKFAERVATVELGAAKINRDNSEAKDLKEQIAALKLELARRSAGEPSRPAKFSPNLVRLKTDSASSVLHFNDEEDELGYLTSNRQSLEEGGNTEVRSNSTKQKKPNHQAEELQVSMDSPWRESCPQLDEDDMEIGSGDWVDKVVVNNNRSRAPSKEEEDGIQEQALFQRYLNEMRVFPEQQANNSAGGRKGGSHASQQSRFDSDSEDFENSASDSSEVELLSHLSASKIPSMADVGMSKLKRPQAKGIKSMDGSSEGETGSTKKSSVNLELLLGRPRRKLKVVMKTLTTSLSYNLPL